MPTVSVIIRTKNRPDFLTSAVLSVLAQTYRPIELVVINDGGEDVLAALDKLLDNASDVSLNYITHEQSKGRTQAANVGLFAASGELSIFLDDDDYFDPHHVEHLVQAHQAAFCDTDNIGAVHCRARAVHVDQQGHEQLLSIQGAPLDEDQLFYQNLMPILTVLFSTRIRDLGVRFDESIDLFEDWDFWLQFAQRGTLFFIDKTTCAYRIHLHQSGALDRAKQNQAYQVIYGKWLSSLDKNRLYALFSKSHCWREAQIEELQQKNSNELLRIGDLHTLALNTIADKDKDIEHLTSIFQELEQKYIALDAVLKSERDEFGEYKAEHLRHIAEQTQQLQSYQETIATLRSDHLEAIAAKDAKILRLRRTHPFICIYSGAMRVVRFCRKLFTRNN